MRLRPVTLSLGLIVVAIATRADEPAPAATPPAPAGESAPAKEAAPAATPATTDTPAPAAAPAPHQATVAEIRARLLEHQRKKTERTEEPKPAATDAPAPAKSAPKSTPAKAEPAKPEPAQVLPKYEIKQMPITELDIKLAKQNRDIAAEKKNTEPTPLDDTLNGKKVSKFFSFLGGQSSDQRASVASERVYIMEQEKDLIEAIADARTKEEKAELEKALADLRKTRRELEQSLR